MAAALSSGLSVRQLLVPLAGAAGLFPTPPGEESRAPNLGLGLAAAVAALDCDRVW